MFNFDQFSLFVICILFVAAAGVVWFSGARLSRYTDALAKKTGTADVVMGTLLLGGVTSLPEIVTTITASVEGDAGIAVNNLFGGVAMQVTILAIADIWLKKRSMTSLMGSPVVELQAIVGIVLMATAGAVIITGDASIANIGAGSILIFVEFLAGFFLINYMQSIHWWKSDPEERDNIRKVRKTTSKKIEKEKKTGEGNNEEGKQLRSFVSMMKTRLFLYLVLSALGVLIAGYTVVQSGQALSSKTGIGSSVIGAIFIALATSLPELSTTISAVKIKEYRLAFSNIFGTNIFTVWFVFLADVFYRKGPILNEVDDFSLFAAILAIFLTAVFLVGLIVRFKKTFLNVGYDSIVVVVAYLTGVVIMVTLLA